MTGRRLAKTVVLTFVAISSTLVRAQTPSFQKLINPTVSPTWSNYALSKDGTVMAANSGGRIYRWSSDTPKVPGGGFTFLDQGTSLSSSIGISQDGSTIFASRPGRDRNVNPATWSRETGRNDMGHPANGCLVDGQWGSGYGVSGDGSRSGISLATALDISADGSTIVRIWEDAQFNQGGWMVRLN